ncbi:alpha-1,6- mannosyltransferase [Coemansia javaensis]|uniref:Mannosyltransferase n=1 Tax=Coemansia javaensis TaxID=2761396 RepID=A0A9W8H8J1_9FUNG|nr:alpha-1,6- mannosyltransferase [Coemansia javaensis]
MGPLDYALAAAVALSAVCVPYTKVEESFFVQAVHDVLRWRGRLASDFDHLEFPGVVPRSFVGPLAIAALVYPAQAALGAEGIRAQVLARVALGWLVVWANSRLRAEVGRVFGRRAARWYGVFCVCQFHYTFWTSRMLGNTLALAPVLLAQSHWLRCLWPNSGSTSTAQRQRSFQIMVAILAFACVVLRFDVAVFAAAMAASGAAGATWRAVRTAAAAALISAALTLAVDSYYWQTGWMWPELRVFWFNAVQGRSAEWGTAPAHYYLTHSIPRLLLGALPLACVGAASDTRAAGLAAACAAAIAVFSANAHKEWRFILPAVPVLNVCAAAGAARLGRGRLATAGVALLAALSLLAAAAMTYVSSLNYPGGHALALLHSLERRPGVRVHIDTYAAMTGASRFGQLRPDWAYNKTEGLVDPARFAAFTHLLTSQPDRHAAHGFEVIGAQLGYAGLQVAPLGRIAESVLSGRSPVAIRQAPLVWVMRNTEAGGW